MTDKSQHVLLYQKLQQTKQSLKDRITQSQNAIARKNEELASLEMRLVVKSDELESLYRTNSDQLSAIVDLKSKVSADASIVRKLEAKVDKLESKISTSHVEAQNLLKELDQKNKEIANLDNQLAVSRTEFESMNSNFKSQVAKLESDISDLETRLHQCNKQRISLDRERAKRDETIASLRSDRDALRERLTTVVAEADTLRDEGEAKTAEVTRLELLVETKSNAFDDEVAQCKKQLEVYRKSFKHKHQQYCQLLKREQSKTNELVAQLARLQDSYAAKADEFEQTTQTLAEARSMLLAEQTRVAVLEEREQNGRDSVRTALDNSESDRLIVDFLTQLSSVERSHSNQLSAVAAERDHLTAELVELKQRAEKARLTHDRFAKTSAEDKSRLEREVSELCDELRTVEAERAHLASNAAQATQAAQAKLRAEVDRLTTQAQRASQESATVAQQLRDKAETLAESVTVLSDEKRTLERLLESERDAVDQTAAKLRDAESDLTASRERISELQLQLEAARVEGVQRERVIEERGCAMQALQEKVDLWKASQHAHYDEWRERESDYTRQISQLMAAVRDKTETAERAQHAEMQTTRELKAARTAAERSEAERSRLSELVAQAYRERDTQAQLVDELKKLASSLQQQVATQRELIDQHRTDEVTDRSKLDETQKALLSTTKQYETVSSRLKDMVAACQAKDASLERLQKQLGAVEQHAALSESRATSEVQRTVKEMEALRWRHTEQIGRLEATHTELTEALRQTEAARRNEETFRSELTSTQHELAHSRRLLSRLRNELVEERSSRSVAEERTVLKDSEIARLEAKVSKYERAFTALSGSQLSLFDGHGSAGNQAESPEPGDDPPKFSDAFASTAIPNSTAFHSVISTIPFSDQSTATTDQVPERDYSVDSLPDEDERFYQRLTDAYGAPRGGGGDAADTSNLPPDSMPALTKPIDSNNNLYGGSMVPAEREVDSTADISDLAPDHETTGLAPNNQGTRDSIPATGTNLSLLGGIVNEPVRSRKASESLRIDVTPSLDRSEAAWSDTVQLDSTVFSVSRFPVASPPARDQPRIPGASRFPEDLLAELDSFLSDAGDLSVGSSSLTPTRDLAADPGTWAGTRQQISPMVPSVRSKADSSLLSSMNNMEWDPTAEQPSTTPNQQISPP